MDCWRASRVPAIAAGSRRKEVDVSADCRRVGRGTFFRQGAARAFGRNVVSAATATAAERGRARWLIWSRSRSPLGGTHGGR